MVIHPARVEGLSVTRWDVACSTRDAVVEFILCREAVMSQVKMWTEIEKLQKQQLVPSYSPAASPVEHAPNPVTAASAHLGMLLHACMYHHGDCVRNSYDR